MNVELIALASFVVRTLRDNLYNNGFIEVFPSQVTHSSGHPFMPPISFSLFDDTWILSQSARTSLLSSNRHLDRVFAITSSFRNYETDQPNRLLEFNYFEFSQTTNFDQLIQFSEALLDAIFQALALANLGGEFLHKLEFPLRRIAYAEFVQAAGVETDELDYESEQRAITKLGGHPILVTKFPRLAKPNVPDLMLANETETLSFSVVCPLVGSIMDGGQVEGDPQRLSTQMIDSPFGAATIQSSTKGANGIQNYVNQIHNSKPISTAGIGIERLLQFVRASRNVTPINPIPSSPTTILVRGSNA